LAKTICAGSKHGLTEKLISRATDEPAAESILPDFVDERYAIRYCTARKATYDDYGINSHSDGSSADEASNTFIGNIAFCEGDEL
jgi:hypothetical protein